MRRLLGAALVLLGVALVLLGLLFLVGAARKGSRLAVAAVGLALGGVAAGCGVRLVRRAAALDPEQLRGEILELARRGNGEVAESEVDAALGDRRDAARPVLEQLLSSGTCQRVRAPGGAVHLVFPELQLRLQERRCEYCGAELPISQEVANCPQCGGAVSTRVVRRSLAAGEVFAMDDEDTAPS